MMEDFSEETDKMDLENMMQTFDETKPENEAITVSPYEKKYYALLRRCQNIQQHNERLLNRICHVRKLLRRLRKERQYLMTRLDQYGDDYKNIPLALFTEEENSLACTDSSTQPIPEKKIKQECTSTSSGFLVPISTTSNQSTVKHGISSYNAPTKKKIKQEKEKDPNAPKRPANPFFLFCQEQRSSITEKYQQEQKEEISHQDLTKTLAKNWNNLLSEDKRIYYEMYEREKERYEQEMKLYSEKESPGGDKTTC